MIETIPDIPVIRMDVNMLNITIKARETLILYKDTIQLFFLFLLFSWSIQFYSV